MNIVLWLIITFFTCEQIRSAEEFFTEFGFEILSPYAQESIILIDRCGNYLFKNV